MKFSTRLFLSFGFFFLFNFSLFAQLIFQKTTTITADPVTSFTFKKPALINQTRADTTSAYYKNIVIFGEGNFRFFDAANEKLAFFTHTYGPFLPGVSSNTVHVRSHSVYSSEEDEVPDEIVIVNDTDSTGVRQTSMVDSNRYIKITRNVEVKPGEPFYTVLSVTNPIQNQLFFSGQLLFFYNGRLTISNKQGDSLSNDYATFSIRENLFYRPDIGELKTLHLGVDPLTPLYQKYENMMLMNINELAPGQEIHYFVDMEGDTTMMDLFKAKTRMKMDFGLALNAFPVIEGPEYINLIPEKLLKEVNDLGIKAYFVNLNQTGVSSDSSLQFIVAEDETIVNNQNNTIQNIASNLVDYNTSTARLVKSHDPNYMIMEACECPAEADLYQVFTTIHCDNDGYGETSNIYIDVKLPDGITANDVIPTPIRYHPYQGADDQIKMIVLTPDSIRWSLENFHIEGTPIHGVGDYRTYAEVQFNMYSSKAPSLLDSVQACIRFESTTGEVVCTMPIKISFSDDELTNGILSCEAGDCSDYPPNDCCVFWCLPCWVWVLILFIVLLIIWLYKRNT